MATLAPTGWRQVGPYGAAARWYLARPCRWPARGSYAVSASAAKSWPQSRQRYVWGWAWTNFGNCPSSVLRPARLDVGKRWRWAVLGVMPIDLHSRMRVRANPRVSANVFVGAGLSRPTSGGKPAGSRPDLGFVGGPGALRWVAARQKFCLGAHSPACLSTISPKPGITSRPRRPI